MSNKALFAIYLILNDKGEKRKVKNTDENVLNWFI